MSPPPEKDSSRISNLSDDVMHFSPKGHVIIHGDLNAWTGIEKDSAQIDKYDEQFDLTIKEPPPERNSKHKATNKRGVDLIDMCVSLDLTILMDAVRETLLVNSLAYNPKEIALLTISLPQILSLRISQYSKLVNSYLGSPITALYSMSWTLMPHSKHPLSVPPVSRRQSVLFGPKWGLINLRAPSSKMPTRKI